ncbi:MAG: hypothetical protein H0W64_02770 [Gammaproteobacteria bacterium]|nr:hypothetical protein [Gammaproteobacteria bacterium]
MKKTGIVLLSFILFWFSTPISWADSNQTLKAFSSPAVKFTLNHEILTMTNTGRENINLANATLSFYYAGEIRAVMSKAFKSTPTLKKQNFAFQPHSEGNFYSLYLKEIDPAVLTPQASVQLKFATDRRDTLHGIQLNTIARVPVPVKVTQENVNWVQTISICNNTTKAIPLKDIEFTFNYAIAMPTNIWGQPWVSWRLASQQGTQVTLLGGTTWTPDLQPDPNCSKPLTIQFNASPSSPSPVGPFVFKAEGGTPVEMGSLTVKLPAAPKAGLNNPTVTVQGMGINTQQIVTWGGQWQLNNLAPGSYTVSASAVDNGSDFFHAAPLTVTVIAQATSQALLQYTAVPSGNVTITLTNSPQSTVPVTFAGNKYNFQKNMSSGVAINLPNDTYKVTSVIPGFTATITPNPLIVPSNTTLNIAYQSTTVITTPRFVGYFQSWSPDSQTADGTKTNLANLPEYVNVVNLAFIKPDAIYTKGSLSLANTGLQFNYSGTVLKQAITSLHQRHPATKILVAIGGASYLKWDSLNAKAIADFVGDFGLDGVDIDYEPSVTGCAVGTDNRIHCQIDAAFEGFVKSLRTLLPRPFWVTVTGYSVAAYGEDQWKTALPQSQFTGMMLPLFRSATSRDIDLVNIMSYDAGTTYDPVQALNAYANYFTGQISMGVEVPPEAWGGNVTTLCRVIQLSEAVKAKATARNVSPAMMLWSLQKAVVGTPTPGNPSAQMMATTICTYLGLINCNQPLLINGNPLASASILKLNCQ